MNKIMIRSIRIFEATAFEKSLNDFASKGYVLMYVFWLLTVFKKSDERVYYQVVKNPRKNKNRYIEFCEEFGVKKVASVALGSLHVFESKTEDAVSLDEQIDQSVYQSFPMIHIAKMIGSYVGLFFVFWFLFEVSNSFSPPLSHYALDDFVQGLWYIAFLVIMAMYDFVCTIYYMVSKKKVEKFMFHTSLRALAMIVAILLLGFVDKNSIYRSVLIILIVICLLVINFVKSSKIHENIIWFTLVFCLSSYQGAISDTYIYLIENEPVLSLRIQDIFNEMMVESQWTYYESESDLMVYGQLNEVVDNTAYLRIIYFEVKDSVLKSRIKQDIQTRYPENGQQGIYGESDYIYHWIVRGDQIVIVVSEEGKAQVELIEQWLDARVSS